MAGGLVLSRRVTERGVHVWARRAGAATSSGVVREYAGWEEWARAGFLRREVARGGVALVLGVGDAMEIFEGEAEGAPRRLWAFVEAGYYDQSHLTRDSTHRPA
jgi:hypothetical protein